MFVCVCAGCFDLAILPHPTVTISTLHGKVKADVSDFGYKSSRQTNDAVAGRLSRDRHRAVAGIGALGFHTRPVCADRCHHRVQARVIRSHLTSSVPERKQTAVTRNMRVPYCQTVTAPQKILIHVVVSERSIVCPVPQSPKRPLCFTNAFLFRSESTKRRHRYSDSDTKKRRCRP